MHAHVRTQFPSIRVLPSIVFGEQDICQFMVSTSWMRGSAAHSMFPFLLKWDWVALCISPPQTFLPAHSLPRNNFWFSELITNEFSVGPRHSYACAPQSQGPACKPPDCVSPMVLRVYHPQQPDSELLDDYISLSPRVGLARALLIWLPKRSARWVQVEVF